MKMGEATEDHRKLPIRVAWNNTLLVENIMDGWLPEKDPR